MSELNTREFIQFGLTVGFCISLYDLTPDNSKTNGHFPLYQKVFGRAAKFPLKISADLLIIFIVDVMPLNNDHL